MPERRIVDDLVDAEHRGRATARSRPRGGDAERGARTRARGYLSSTTCAVTTARVERWSRCDTTRREPRPRWRHGGQARTRVRTESHRQRARARRARDASAISGATEFAIDRHTRLGCSRASRERSSRSSHTRNASTSRSAVRRRPRVNRAASTTGPPVPPASRPIASIAKASGTSTRSRARSRDVANDRAQATTWTSPAIAVHRDRRAGRNASRRVLHADDARNPELARDDRAVRQHAAALDHEPGDERKHWPPAGIGLLRDEHVAAREARRFASRRASTVARPVTRPPHALVPDRTSPGVDRRRVARVDGSRSRRRGTRPPPA